MKNLVILWGFNRHAISYQGLVDSAPEDWRVYQIPYSQLMPNGKNSQLFKNLLDFINRKKLNKVHLLGHSLGGALALDFVIHHPEVVEALFLVDSAGVYDQKPLLNGFYKTVRYGSATSTKWYKNAQELIKTLRTPILYTKLGFYAHHANLDEQAKSLKMPVTLLWGKNDRITPVWQGEKLHQSILGSKLIVLPNQGHDWIITSPGKFWQNI